MNIQQLRVSVGEFCPIYSITHTHRIRSELRAATTTRIAILRNVIIVRSLDTEQRLRFNEKLRIYQHYIGQTLADVEYFKKGYNRPI